MSEILQNFMKKINYQFNDSQLLEKALRHRSSGKDNNERLEFLGDAILNFIIADDLFKRFPKAKEGELSRLRSNLVNEETLAKLAKDFELCSVIILGKGESKSGGCDRPSIIADCIEAIIGAIYLDRDIQECYKIVIKWYTPFLQGLSLSNIIKDPKSLLQELMQANQLPLPKYRLIKTSGRDHEQIFVIECKVDMLDHPVTAEGRNRQKAEQAAASKALQELKHEE